MKESFCHVLLYHKTIVHLQNTETQRDIHQRAMDELASSNSNADLLTSLC